MVAIASALKEGGGGGGGGWRARELLIAAMTCVSR
jgi:hypothetical protein